MKESAQFFDNPQYKRVDKFYVTDDGGHYINQGDARNHANALLKARKGTGKVTPVTRAEYEAWKQKENGSMAESLNSSKTAAETVVNLTPRQLAEKALADAKAALEAANSKKEAAQKTLDGANATKAALGADATGQQKAQATKAVNTATKALQDATTEAFEAVGEVESLEKELADLPE